MDETNETTTTTAETETEQTEENDEFLAGFDADDETVMDDDGGQPEQEQEPAAPEPEQEKQEEKPEEKPAPGPAPEKPPDELDYKALYQARLEQDNAEHYRQVYNEQLAATGSEALARMIAANECGGKSYPLDEPQEKSTEQAAAPTDFRAELAALKAQYPDLKEMPEQVTRDYANGMTLKDAYTAWRTSETMKENAELKAEVEKLKQEAARRAAAPVKGTTGDIPPDETDEFLAGLNMDD